MLPRPEIQIESNAWPLVLSFPTEDVHLGGVRRALGDWLDNQGACVPTRSAVVLATHEAVANAVEHSMTGHSVTIRGQADHGNVTIEVSDDGDWQQATLRTKNADAG